MIKPNRLNRNMYTIILINMIIIRCASGQFKSTAIIFFSSIALIITVTLNIKMIKRINLGKNIGGISSGSRITSPIRHGAAINKNIANTENTQAKMISIQTECLLLLHLLFLEESNELLFFIIDRPSMHLLNAYCHIF